MTAPLKPHSFSGDIRSYGGLSQNLGELVGEELETTILLCWQYITIVSHSVDTNHQPGTFSGKGPPQSCVAGSLPWSPQTGPMGWGFLLDKCSGQNARVRYEPGSSTIKTAAVQIKVFILKTNKTGYRVTRKRRGQRQKGGWITGARWGDPSQAGVGKRNCGTIWQQVSEWLGFKYRKGCVG